jgi:acyl-CoA synthetase (AMP-forming)/AMP-acid ligase II
MANIEAVPRTLPQLVARAGRLFGAKEAVVDGQTRLSWAEIDALRRRAGRALIRAGIKHGDRVAIQAPNIHEYIIAAMGLQSIGAIFVPVNTRFKGVETADILRRSNAKLLFTIVGFLGADYPAMIKGEDLPDLQRIVLIRGEAPGLTSWQAFLAEGDAVPEAEFDQRAAAVKPEDVADLMFTSGTTGKPKGALLTHLQNTKGYESFSNIYGLSRDDVMLVIPPFFHSFGYKAGWVACTIFGSRIIPALTFDVDEVLPLIEREKISVIPGPPTIFHSLLAHPRRKEFDLSSLRLAMTGAATVPVELVRRMYSELGFQTVTLAYGLTENTAIVSLTRPGDDPVKTANTVGKALPEITVECVDPEGKAVPQGKEGEIVISGYLVMKGYFNDPKATAEAIDSQGRLHTGDVGRYDEDGYLCITDRLKDMYIVGGFNCYPAEIENILTQMPGVAQACVIGIADERMGEVGKAFIIRRAGSNISAQDVIDWSREHMANFKVPRQVEFVDAYPLNATGKIQKSELRAKEKIKGK